MEETHDALRPESFEEFYGQATLKRQLTTMMGSARERGAPLGHILLAGPPGFGKTSLAGIIAESMRDPLLELRMPVSHTALQRSFQRFDAGIIFLDELHAAGKGEQEDLLTVLEDGYFSTRQGRRIEMPCVTVIGATTEPEKIIPPLYDRFEHKPVFGDYSQMDMEFITIGMMHKLGMDTAKMDALIEAIAIASAGVPRVAKHLAEGARDLYITSDKEIPQVADVLELRQIAPDGLDANQVKYLELLHDVGGGPVGLVTMTTLLRLHESTIRNMERVLLTRGLIELTPQGRIITNAGVRRVAPAPQRKSA